MGFEYSLLTLELDFVLNDKRFPLVIDLFGEFGGDGMMGCRVLDHETFIALNTLEYRGLFDSPLSDICPFLISLRIFLLCMRRRPALCPVIRKLFQEWCLDV